MRIVLAVLMAVHGIAHLPGFLVSWRLATFPELPFRTTILGTSVDVGEIGIRVVGLLWLAAGAAFVAVAAVTAMRVAWWQPAAYTLIALSAGLCLLGWPDARLGLAANAVVALLIVVGTRAGWL